MSDDRLRDFTRDAVRRLSGGEPPLRDTPVEPGSPGWYPFDRDPRRPDPEPDPAEEPPAAATEQPNEGRIDETPLGQFMSEAAQRGGWGQQRPAPEKITEDDSNE